MKPFFVFYLFFMVILFASSHISHAQTNVPRFELSDCPIDVPDDPPINCGYLVVPENYSDPLGATIRLPVIIIHSRSPHPATDPLLFTGGGPGYSSLNSVWGFARSSFVENRDIIILEQRGNIYAEPSLECDVSIWWEENEGNTACLNSLLAKGIDLTNYTTEAIVADINALRKVLDYDEWNLYGVSYSTRLMLLTMHLHPESIRSVILVSVNPPTENRYKHDPEHAVRAINVMLDDCATNPIYAKAYPDLRKRLYSLVSRLNNKPVAFEIIHPETGEPFTESVDGNRLLGWMVTDAFYGPARQPHKTAYLPLLIDQVEKGNTDLLYPWLIDELSRLIRTNFAYGLYFAVNCQDDAPAVTLADMEAEAMVYPELEGYVRHRREIAICEAWNLSASTPIITEPVESDIPTLILAGTYDPITPPKWSRITAENLSNSYYVEFSSAGHNVNMDNPCADSIMVAFVNDPTSTPDTSCIANVLDPEFVLPQDIYIAPGVYNIIYDVDLGNPERGKPLLEAIAVADLIIFLVEIVFLVIAGLVYLVRLRNRIPSTDRIARIAHPLAGLNAILVWISVWLISNINTHFLSTNRLVLYFGLSTAYPPVFALGVIAIVTTVFTVGLVVVTVLTWLRNYWTILGRIFFSSVTLAAIAFTGFLAKWDLITLLL